MCGCSPAGCVRALGSTSIIARTHEHLPAYVTQDLVFFHFISFLRSFLSLSPHITCSLCEKVPHCPHFDMLRHQSTASRDDVSGR